jgi:hypothetical protein
VIATSELDPLEWAAREAGAMGFFAPPLSENELVSLCGRLLDYQIGPNLNGTATQKAK